MASMPSWLSVLAPNMSASTGAATWAVDPGSRWLSLAASSSLVIGIAGVCGTGTLPVPVSLILSSLPRTEDTMCYERRSSYEKQKTVATEPKRNEDKRDERVDSLLKEAEKAGQKTVAPARQPIPVK